MNDKISLPLSFLINTEVAEEELLKRNQLQRLLVIGKSDNARGSPYGVYKTVDEVKAHYGVEASEYRIASHYFNQVEGGELVIASADYNSVDRVIEIEPPVVVEPEPDDDTDFNRDYVALAYEPIDVEYIEPPEVEPEPEEEPEPEPITCLSSEARFNVANTLQISPSEALSIWASIEVQGVEYKVSTGKLGGRQFLQDLRDDGTGYTSNRILSSLINDLVTKHPSRGNYIFEHTNYALTSFDYGKELSGLDALNKDVFAEELSSIGGKAEYFSKEPSVIKIKNLTADEINRRNNIGAKAVNLLDLFNKGKEVLVNSCLSFKYTPPKPTIDILCQANDVGFHSFNNTYISNRNKQVKVAAIITIDGNDYEISLKPFNPDFLEDMIASYGTAHTANEMLAALLSDVTADKGDIRQHLHETTNFAVSKHDFSIEFGGVDANNMDIFKQLVALKGEVVDDFRNEGSTIRIRGVASYKLSMMSNEDVEYVNFTDLFNNKQDAVIASCLRFDYTPKRLPDITPPEPDPDDRPDYDISDTALIFNIKPNDAGGRPRNLDEISMIGGVTISLFNYEEESNDYTAPYHGEFAVKINDVVVADSNGVYDPSLVDDEADDAIAVMLGGGGMESIAGFYFDEFTYYDEVAGHFLSGNTKIEVFSNAHSVVIGYANSDKNIDITQLPKGPNNVHVTFRVDNANNNFTLPDELPKNIIDLSSAFEYSNNITQDLNWDVAHVKYFEYVFASDEGYVGYSGTPFRGSSFESAVVATNLFEGNRHFNKPLEWTNFDPQYLGGIFDGASLFNQNIDFIDSSSWGLADFVAFFGQDMASFNQDLSHWSTASTPERYMPFTNEFNSVKSIKESNPQWTEPKPIFGILYKMQYDEETMQSVEVIITNRFDPDFAYTYTYDDYYD